jgi:hypothetical protein
MMNPVRPWRLPKARPALVLFLAAWAVYNLNCRPITSGDTAPAALLPFLVVLDGTLTFDRYADGLSSLYDGKAFFLRERNGHSYSRYPIVAPLLISPAYLPLRLVAGIRDWPLSKLIVLARVLEKIWASAIAAASVAALFVLLRRLTERKYALLLALVFGFATNTWSTSSQALWQHGMTQLTIILSLLSMHSFLASGSRRACALAGLFAALGFGVRPTNVLFFAISCAVLLILTRDRRTVLASFGGFGLLMGCGLAFYNLWVFGSLTGGYADESFGGAFLTGLAGLSFSPSHGLFVYSPVVLFALAGVFLCARPAAIPSRAIFVISACFFLSLLLLYAHYSVWWGGACYGPRYMTDAIPAAVLLMAPWLPLLKRSRLARTVFAGAAVVSLTVQLVGVFCYAPSERPERPLWDWKNNPIVSNASAGVYSQGYSVLWDYIRGRQPDYRERGLRVQ